MQLMMSTEPFGRWHAPFGTTPSASCASASASVPRPRSRIAAALFSSVKTSSPASQMLLFRRPSFSVVAKSSFATRTCGPDARLAQGIGLRAELVRFFWDCMSMEKAFKGGVAPTTSVGEGCGDARLIVAGSTRNATGVGVVLGSAVPGLPGSPSMSMGHRLLSEYHCMAWGTSVGAILVTVFWVRELFRFGTAVSVCGREKTGGGGLS